MLAGKQAAAQSSIRLQEEEEPPKLLFELYFTLHAAFKDLLPLLDVDTRKDLDVADYCR